MPYARFKDINEQLKVARAFQEQHRWVETFQQDPLPAIEQWLDQLSGHPEIGPKLLAKAARMLQSRRGQTPAAAPEKPPPDVPILDQHGNDTGRRVYSAEQQDKLDEWRWQQREAALTERFSPLEDLRQKAEQAEQRQALEQQATTAATTTLEKLRLDPFFTEHEAAIKAEFAAHEEYGDNVALAALTVLSRDVLPARDATTSAKVLTQLQTQANGASVHPSGVTPTARPTFKTADGREDWEAALRWFAEHPDDAAATLAQR